jgi:hypothetical protein
MWTGNAAASSPLPFLAHFYEAVVGHGDTISRVLVAVTYRINKCHSCSSAPLPFSHYASLTHETEQIRTRLDTNIDAQDVPDRD